MLRCRCVPGDSIERQKQGVMCIHLHCKACNTGSDTCVEGTIWRERRMYRTGRTARLSLNFFSERSLVEGLCHIWSPWVYVFLRVADIDSFPWYMCFCKISPISRSYFHFSLLSANIVTGTSSMDNISVFQTDLTFSLPLSILLHKF